MIEFLKSVISQIDVLCFPWLISPIAKSLIDLHVNPGSSERYAHVNFRFADRISIINTHLSNKRVLQKQGPYCFCSSCV